MSAAIVPKNSRQCQRVKRQLSPLSGCLFVGHEAMSRKKNTSCRRLVVREIEHAVSREGYFHELSLVQREGPHPRSIDAAIVDVAIYGRDCLLPNVIPTIWREDYAAFFLLRTVGNGTTTAPFPLLSKVDSKVSFLLMISVSAMSASRVPGGTSTSGR